MTLRDQSGNPPRPTIGILDVLRRNVERRARERHPGKRVVVVVDPDGTATLAIGEPDVQTS